MTEGRIVAMWVRVLVAVSVFWVLMTLGIIYVEYLIRDPSAEHYFWDSSGVGLLGTTEERIRNLEPKVLRIISVLFGPLPVFWVAGWLVVWVRDGFKSRG
jgi:hypothetical protein